MKNNAYDSMSYGLSYHGKLEHPLKRHCDAIVIKYLSEAAYAWYVLFQRVNP